MANPTTIKVVPTIISAKKCKANFQYWKSTIATWVTIGENYSRINEDSINVLPAHTSAYEYLKTIFSYDKNTGQFNSNAEGFIAQKLREPGLVPDNHMTDSQKLGHDIFLFSYHNVHNPHHRHNDDPPVKPLGFFISKDIEFFSYVHATPCDITRKNELVDRNNLDKYYILAEDLRKYKTQQVLNDTDLKNNFWYYFGNPTDWANEEDYGLNLFKKAGEFRYYRNIRPSSIKAVLWPFFTEYIPLNDDAANENLDLYNSFNKAFPEITVIKYFLDNYDNDWELALVESSYYSQLFYLKNGYFHKSAAIAKNELQ